MMKNFLTSSEAASYLGITEKELEDTVIEGKVSSYKIGGIYTRFKVEELDSYRRSLGKTPNIKDPSPFTDKIKDFFYFNDFYITAGTLIALILYFIFR